MKFKQIRTTHIYKEYKSHHAGSYNGWGKLGHTGATWNKYVCRKKHTTAFDLVGTFSEYLSYNV